MYLDKVINHRLNKILSTSHCDIISYLFFNFVTISNFFCNYFRDNPLSQNRFFYEKLY